MDLNLISAPFRDLIRKKANASHLPNAVLFSGNATPYSLPFTDLTSHVLKEKESTMLRMLSGAPISRQTIHCPLARGHRLLTDHLSYSSTPVPCATITDSYSRALPHTHCWALSLIQYLQSSQSNLSISFPPPLTSSSHTITQTPLHSHYDPSIDLPLSLNDIIDFEASYHIHFLEDLFPSTPITPNSYLLRLLPLFPPFIHNYLSRIIHTQGLHILAPGYRKRKEKSSPSPGLQAKATF